MACYRSFLMYRLENGSLVSAGPQAARGIPVRLPCGRCFGCLMERCQMWSMRCRHEAQSWDHNCFLTLTYDDDHLPAFGSLDRSHVQKFVKRLRRAVVGVQAAPGSDRRPVRFFGCGEYGTRTRRPHYHLLLFNVRFTDRERYGDKTFTSALVSSLWPYGSHLIGDVTPASASYVAGYASKKVFGRVEAERHYEVVDPLTGECFQRVPEFSCMSLKPGIGQYWYDRYKSDLASGFVVLDGAKVPVPRFYEDQYCEDFPGDLERRDWERDRRHLNDDPAEKSQERLFVAEAVARARKVMFDRSKL